METLRRRWKSLVRGIVGDDPLAMSAETEAWILRTASILEYPFEVKCRELESVKQLMRWLEDRKVREWEIDARKEWNDDVISRYLSDLKCPARWPSADCLMFLLGVAIEREYEDGEDGFERDSEEWTRKRKNEASVREEKRKLCGEGDLLDILSGVVARKRRSGGEDALGAAAYPLGFASSGCERTDEIARNLRILYLIDLRELQDSINDILIRAQNDIVSAPKTNAALAKVGR